MLDTKSRILKTWNFEEPDRVPIEISIYKNALDMNIPGADEILRFQNEEADNFLSVRGFDWGFIGLDSEYSEKIIEDVPGSYRRIMKTHMTPAGSFHAITKHTYTDLSGEGDPGDFHWEKRYIETIDDFRRLTEAVRSVRPFDVKRYNLGCAEIGNRGVPIMTLLHPMGVLIRNSNMSEAYMWLMNEEDLFMDFLEKSTAQVRASVLSINGAALADPPVFNTSALEMFIPPWFGKSLFMKYIFPFDKTINEAVHSIGGRHMAHCHGNSGEYLELFADMGIDAVDPLEPSPYGDNILADAKKKVGKKMLLRGNIPSQVFAFEPLDLESVREMTKSAIRNGAAGGGFTLKTTGSHVGNGKTREQKIRSIQCALAIIDTWREYGKY